MRKYVPHAMKQGRTRMIVRTEAKKNPAWMLFFYYHWMRVLTYIGLVLLYYVVFLHNRSPIEQISFTPESKAQLHAPELWDAIEQSFDGESYYKTKLLSRSKHVREIQQVFPLVKSIHPLNYKDGTATLAISYYSPDFIAHSSEGTEFLVFRNTLASYQTGDTLVTTGIHIQIAAPVEQLQSYSGGIFFGTNSTTLAQIVKRITFLSGDFTVTFFPGWEKLSVTHGNQVFIFSSKKESLDLTLQKRQEIMPYLPISDPARVDLSNPERIIIQQ